MGSRATRSARRCCRSRSTAAFRPGSIQRALRGKPSLKLSRRRGKRAKRSPKRSSGARSLNDLEAKVYHSHGHAPAFDAVEQHLGAAAADFVAWKPKRSERRVDEAHEVEIIEARDRKAPRDLPALAVALEQ